MAATYQHTGQLPEDLEEGVIRLMQDGQLSFNALILRLIRQECDLVGMELEREDKGDDDASL